MSERKAPTTKTMDRLKTMNVLIEPELRDRVKVYGNTNGIKLFKIFEIALTEYLDREEANSD